MQSHTAVYLGPDGDVMFTGIIDLYINSSFVFHLMEVKVEDEL